MATPDLQRLAALIKRRRRELNLSVVRAARAAGMSRDTWSRIESGLPARLMNYDKIEDVLQWAVGSCQKIMDGGEPVETGSPDERSAVEYAPVPPEMLEEEVRQAVAGAMVAGTNLTGDRIREVSDEAIAYLRKRGILRVPDGD